MLIIQSVMLALNEPLIGIWITNWFLLPFTDLQIFFWIFVLRNRKGAFPPLFSPSPPLFSLLSLFSLFPLPLSPLSPSSSSARSESDCSLPRWSVSYLWLDTKIAPTQHIFCTWSQLLLCGYGVLSVILTQITPHIYGCLAVILCLLD